MESVEEDVDGDEEQQADEGSAHHIGEPVHAEIHPAGGDEHDHAGYHAEHCPASDSTPAQHAGHEGQKAPDGDRGKDVSARERRGAQIDQRGEVGPGTAYHELEASLEHGSDGDRDEDREGEGGAAPPDRYGHGHRCWDDQGAGTEVGGHAKELVERQVAASDNGLLHRLIDQEEQRSAVDRSRHSEKEEGQGTGDKKPSGVRQHAAIGARRPLPPWSGHHRQILP